MFYFNLGTPQRRWYCFQQCLFAYV